MKIVDAKQALSKASYLPEDVCCSSVYFFKFHLKINFNANSEKLSIIAANGKRYVTEIDISSLKW